MGDLIHLDRAQPRHITGKLPNKNTGTGRHGMALRGDDLYPTPAPLTKALLRHHALPKNIWEPAAGLGHMAAVLEQAGHDVFCSDLVDYGTPIEGSPEITAPVDFLKDDYFSGRPGEVIVTNPPFAISGDFVRRGLQLCDEVVILNRIQFLEGKSRADILDKHLAKVMVFSRRCPMMHRFGRNEAGAWVAWEGKRADSAMCFAWFIFRKDARKSGPATIERITWLNSDL